MQTISRSWLRRILPVLFLSSGWGLPALAAAADEGRETPSEVKPLRERDVDPAVPEISFIEGPTATCYLSTEVLNLCYVEWDYLYVTAGDSKYILNMTIEIDGRLRAVVQGFFQNNAFVPADMYRPGFEVACGNLGAGGVPGRGNLYSYVIKAQESGGLTAANYGTVVCPTLQIFADDFESGDDSAWSSTLP
jgi:hypothetical protein